MNFLSNLWNRPIITKPVSDIFTTIVREKAKKSTGSVRRQRQGVTRKPRYHGRKKNDGDFVEPGMVLYTQARPRFHPGLNVVFGKNATLNARERGKVVVSCEKTDLAWGRGWVDRHYSEFQDVPVYKKYYNVIPEKQDNKFILVDKI